MSFALVVYLAHDKSAKGEFECGQGEKMERNIKAYISIALGVLFCGSVLIGYIPIPKYVIELTCISNSCIGILLLFTGINMLAKKKKNSEHYLPYVACGDSSCLYYIMRWTF